MPNASDRAKLQKAANNVSGEGGWWKYFGEYVWLFGLLFAIGLIAEYPWLLLNYQWWDFNKK